MISTFANHGHHSLSSPLIDLQVQKDVSSFQPHRSRKRPRLSSVLMISVSCESQRSSVISLVRHHHRYAKQSPLVCSSLSQCSRYFASSMGLAQSSIMFHMQLELFSIFNTLCRSTDFVSMPPQISRPSSDLKSHVKPLVKLQHENSKRNHHLKPVCRVGSQVSTPIHR